jgi:N-acetylneuraminate synthase
MRRNVKINGHLIGDGEPTFVIAEIGINHIGDLEIAKRLIDAACLAGCNAVKFQKRTPELCVPPEQQGLMRETPWGVMSYLDYRFRVEFGVAEYDEIQHYCSERNLTWFASPWDEPSVDFLEMYSPACYKIPSAALTDYDLLRYLRATGRPLMLSTGMSTMEQIREAVGILGTENLLVAQCTSTYPCQPAELNLRMIQTLRNEFDCPIGYSGHEVGLQTTYAAVVLGACFVERHITLDRAMWGSDQAASVEPSGFARMVRDIRVIEKALGDGVKRVYESEVSMINRLRRVKVEVGV